MMQTKVLRKFSQIVTMAAAHRKDGRGLQPEDLSIINDGSMVYNEKEILWLGTDNELPKKFHSLGSKSHENYVMTPGLVDCHTHLIFGGDRSKEYSMRLNGGDYQKIARSGGGILSTMQATNSQSITELIQLAQTRIDKLYSYGVKTIEIKSGYGLNFSKEYEISVAINDLKNKFAEKVLIKNTFMAAHAIPLNFSSSTEYMHQVVIPLLEKLAPLKIIDAVDIFHETGYFNRQDTEQLFNKAKELNLNFKSHADEFQDNKGALLAAKMGALSTDHLLNTGQDGIQALANSQTVATLLPGTGFFLGKPQANARSFLDALVKVAIGSDYNPGSCHWDNVLQIAAMAAPQYKMNIAELWASITLNAAHALGLKNQGVLMKGFRPIFSTFKLNNLDQITYNWGKNYNENIY